jgi:hypothetical protein
MIDSGSAPWQFGLTGAEEGVGTVWKTLPGGQCIRRHEGRSRDHARRFASTEPTCRVSFEHPEHHSAAKGWFSMLRGCRSSRPFCSDRLSTASAATSVKWLNDATVCLPLTAVFLRIKLSTTLICWPCSETAVRHAPLTPARHRLRAALTSADSRPHEKHPDRAAASRSQLALFALLALLHR